MPPFSVVGCRSMREFVKKAVQAIAVAIGTTVFCGTVFGLLGGAHSLLSSDHGFFRGFFLFFLAFGPYTGCAGLICASVESYTGLGSKISAGVVSGIIGALSLCFYFDVLTNDRFHQLDRIEYLTWPAFWGACGLFLGVTLAMKESLAKGKEREK